MICDDLAVELPNALVRDASRLDVCSARPMNAEDVLSKSLGSCPISLDAPVKTDKAYIVTVPAVMDGRIEKDGEIRYWALTGAGKLLATAPVTGAKSVKTGNQFQVASITFRFPR